MGDEVDFLPADKDKNFQQDDNITGCAQPGMLEVPKPTSLKYHKENVKDEVDFLPADKPQRFLQIDTRILDVCGQGCLDYPK